MYAGLPRKTSILLMGLFLLKIKINNNNNNQLYERGVDLEVEGVRYIEMHRGPAAYVLGPPPSRGRDLELEGGVNACHVDYVYEPQDSHVRGTE